MTEATPFDASIVATAMPPPMPYPAHPTAAPPPALRRVLVRRIGVLSFAKFYGLMMAVFGLIGGAVFAMVASVGVAATGDGMLAGMGAIFLVVFPVLYGLIGFVVGAILAAVYNAIAGAMGGIELEVQ